MGKERYIIVKPASALFLEDRAANEFAKYAKMLLGRDIKIIPDINLSEPSQGVTYILIGSGELNIFTRQIEPQFHFAVDEKIPKHRESFVIFGKTSPDNNVLLFAGKNPIGTLYAVYEYLEKFCGVGFFQDGERVPKLDNLPIENISVIEQPRFDNRMHLCWNAHRAIKKYHAFYWTLDEWKRELDWMAKRHMNMMRLDMPYFSRFPGDAFEQAFPEIGPEPNERLYHRMGGWTIEWDWKPAYRREMTKEIFKYGRSLGIRFIYSLSYANVPFRFKDMHPEYKYLPANAYGESREIDPTDPAAFEVEKKYVKKIIEIFGTDHLYMYSPYAEIDVGDGSVEKNLEMRIKASHGILKLIEEVDPKGIWVTDSWDLHEKKRWNPENVKKYLDSFPAEKMYLYDTAADIAEPKLYKTHNWWHGKKWAFGILHCYAGEEALHGDPADLTNRIKEVATCPTCTGLFMNPEITHHNIMFWDLATHLAWQPDKIDFQPFLRNYVERRYGKEMLEPMLEAWEKIVKAVYWYKERPTDYVLMRMCSPHFPWYQWTGNQCANIISCPVFPERELHLNEQMEDFKRELPLLKDALETLLKYQKEQKSNPLYIEDVVVVFRSFSAKCFNRALGAAYYAFREGDLDKFKKYRKLSMTVMKWVEDVLSVVPSHSINKTIAEACEVKDHNPMLPEMIRNNSINLDYVNNDVYEQFQGQFVPRWKLYFDLVEKKIKKGDKYLDFKELKPKFDEIDQKYRLEGCDVPLKKGNPISKVAQRFKDLLDTGVADISNTEMDFTATKMRLIQQTKDCSDFDIILAGDKTPSFRIVFPEHLQGEGIKRISGTHQVPGKWETRGDVISGIFKAENAFEISVEINPAETEIEASMKLKNLMDHEIKDLYVEVCVSPGHLPGNPNWSNRKFLPESPLDRDLQGQEWYGKVAPKKLRALTANSWIFMHPNPDDPDPAKVPQYSFTPSEKAEAFACAVQSADGEDFFYQAWNTNCIHVTPSRGNACMHLLPLVTKSLPPGKEAGVTALIGIHKGTWESLTEKIAMFRKNTVLE